jgi:hypothetical protein
VPNVFENETRANAPVMKAVVLKLDSDEAKAVAERVESR